MRTGSSRYAWYRGDIVIDFTTCANAKAFIESTRGYLPSIEAEIEKFKADWEEIDRKFKQKEGYWRRSVLCHITGVLDDLMKFGFLGPSSPSTENEIVLFKYFKKPQEVPNKWEHWEIIHDFFNADRRRFYAIWDIYQIRNNHAAHTGRPLKEDLLTKDDLLFVQKFLADALKHIRDSFCGDDE